MYRIQARAGVLLLSSTALMGGAGAAHAQSPEVSVEEVVVTGTRTRGRSALESNVPIDVISNVEMSATGFSETNETLERILPSFTYRRDSINDAADHVRPAIIRGMGPDHTLVLVNGKRRHASALFTPFGLGAGTNSTDLNAIPSSAIERLEVLRDGAAAQYGSDAIAGVLNIILKSAREGGELSVKYDQYDTTMSAIEDYSRVILDNATRTLRFEPGGKRKVRDGETLTVSGDIGLPIGEEGYFHLSGEYRDAQPTNRQGFDSRRMYDFLPNGDFDPREATFDRYNFRYGNARVEDMNVFFNAGVPVNDAIEAYAFGSYGKRKGESGGYYRLPRNSRNVPQIYPDGYLPLIVSDIEDYSLAGGTRGTLGEWNADLSVTFGRDVFDLGVRNSLNRSFGVRSPTEFYNGQMNNQQYVTNLDLARLYDDALFGRPLNVAFGIEHRSERYQIKAGEYASWATDVLRDANGVPILDGSGNTRPGGPGGAQVLAGFKPENAIVGKRHNVGFYVDLDSDLTDRWNLAVAARFEEYSDFGSTLDGKIAMRFEVVPGFALRGAVSTGFRAPSLAQGFYQATSTEFVDGVPQELGHFFVGHPVAVALGAKPLKPEEARNYSVGFVATPLRGFDITVDFYQIDLDDRITRSGILDSAEVQAILSAAGFGQIEGVQFMTNNIDTRTRGVDVVAGYQLEAGRLGRFNFTAGINFNDVEVTRIAPVPEVLAQNAPGEVLFSRSRLLQFEKGAPESKINVGTAWTFGDLTTFARAVRYGETLSSGEEALRDQGIAAEWVFDLDLTYRFDERVTVSFGANNLFDVYPEIEPIAAELATDFDRILPYKGGDSPWGFNGRLLYGRLSYRF